MMKFIYRSKASLTSNFEKAGRNLQTVYYVEYDFSIFMKHKDAKGIQ